MTIYTRRGDTGTTSILNNSKRLPKSHPLIKALGSLDELNSHLSLVISILKQSPPRFNSHAIKKTKNPQTHRSQPATNDLEKIQKNLFHLSTLLQKLTPSSNNLKSPESKKLKSFTKSLESQIDHLQNQLPPLNQFLLFNSHLPSAHLHLARAVCRRTERTIASLAPPQEILAYLNRLSDYLFTLARYLSHQPHLSPKTHSHPQS